jgi:hypothetical protein
VSANKEQKRQVLAEIELENVARAARGDFRATYILCPEQPSHWQIEKMVEAPAVAPPTPTPDARSPASGSAPIEAVPARPCRRGGAVMRRDPAKAILVLDAMLEFFDGGRRWTQGALHDETGQNRCLIGALHYVRQQQRIRGAATEFYLRTALLSALNEENQWQIDEVLPDPLIEFALARLSGAPEPSNPDYDLTARSNERPIFVA